MHVWGLGDKVNPSRRLRQAKHFISGLGATIIDLVAPAAEQNPELRRLFRIPENNEVLAAMVTGYPKYRFQKSIRRSSAE